MLDKKLLARLGLGVTGQGKSTAIRGWQFDIDHLDRSHCLNRSSRRQPRRQGAQPFFEGHLQAIGVEAWT